MGVVDFGSDTARWFRNEVESPWFAHWLKGEEKPELPEVWAFRSGANVWERFDRWPPVAGIEERKLYLMADGGLSFTPPAARQTDAFDSYVSDPDKPGHYRNRPNRNFGPFVFSNGWPEWQLEDQRLAHGRPDVLIYVSESLEADQSFSGESVAHPYAATTGSDSDWIVKLIDVYPQDYEPDPTASGFPFLVAGEVFRGRYRKSFERPEPIEPGQVTAYEIHLRSRSHTFKAGHRIIVQIQSTWFPMIARNPQTYVDNIYKAKRVDFHKATQSIYRSAAYPSHISCPVRK